MQKSACSRHNCICGVRCIKCSYNFVERENMVCEACIDQAYCENQTCNRHSSVLYNKLYRLPHAFSTKRFGKCVQCEEDRDLNTYGVCMACNHIRSSVHELKVCTDCFEKPPFICDKCHNDSEVLIQGSTCPECYYSEGWVEDETTGEAACLVCSNVRPLNRGCVCKYCYLDNALIKVGANVKVCPDCGRYTAKGNTRCSNCTKILRNCVECRGEFVPTMERQWECEKCRPKCSACTTSFNRQYYWQHQCNDCARSSADGLCALCQKPSSLDDRGLCHTCGKGRVQFGSLGFACIKCETGRSTTPRGLCHECSSEGYSCPHCSVNRILDDSLICQNCAQSSSKHYQTYAKHRGKVL